jgi:hypothetical protein
MFLKIGFHILARDNFAGSLLPLMAFTLIHLH